MITTLRQLSYEDRLKQCKLTTLGTRRIMGDQTEVFIIMNGFENIDKSVFFFVMVRELNITEDIT